MQLAKHYLGEAPLPRSYAGPSALHLPCPWSMGGRMYDLLDWAIAKGSSAKSLSHKVLTHR